MRLVSIVIRVIQWQLWHTCPPQGGRGLGLKWEGRWPRSTFSRGLGNSPWELLVAPGGKRRSSQSPLQERWEHRAVCWALETSSHPKHTTHSSLAFLSPVLQGEPSLPGPSSLWMVWRDQQLGGWSLAHFALASSSRGSLTGKAEAELAAREEAASLVSADLGTQQLLMDGVRPGQAPWEPQTIHYRPPVPHTASSGLGINLCLGSQRAKGEHSAA